MIKQRTFITKRTFDLIVSCLALPILFPFLIIIFLMVWTLCGYPIFYLQKRPGLKGRPFWILKFRTMKDVRDFNGEYLPDSKRITRLGQFLRAFSLDEIPEIWNVLKGEMSMVGPRPLLMRYLNRYSTEQARRHEVKPGITGLAQVNGRNAITWEEKFKFDVWYVDNWSLRLDIKIIGLTIWKILKREGINQPGQATMEEFKGRQNMESNQRFLGWKYPDIEEGRPTKFNWIVQNVSGLKLGYKTDIGAYSYINAKYGVTIADYVQIGSHCSIYSVSTIDDKHGEVVLNKNCRIGSHSVIMPGVTIGENAIVGAFSFVNFDIPANATAVGIPAKVIQSSEKN